MSRSPAWKKIPMLLISMAGGLDFLVPCILLIFPPSCHPPCGNVKTVQGFCQGRYTQIRCTSLWFVTWSFYSASSFRQVDDGHPLIQTATVSAETIQFAQGWVFACRWLWFLQRTQMQVNQRFRLDIEDTYLKRKFCMPACSLNSTNRRDKELEAAWTTQPVWQQVT